MDQKKYAPPLIVLIILILVCSWIFTLFGLPLFFPKAGSCDITISDGSDFSNTGAIDWSVDVRPPVFMTASYTVEAFVRDGIFDHENASAYAVYGSGENETVVDIGDRILPIPREAYSQTEMDLSVPSSHHGKKLTRVYGRLPVDRAQSQFAVSVDVRAPTAPTFVMPFLAFRNTAGQTADGGLLDREYVLIKTQQETTTE